MMLVPPPPGIITLLGLGPGNPGLLTRDAWAVIHSASEIYLRTDKHPVVEGFPENLAVHTFDDIYEEEADFEHVYARIVDRVLGLGRRPEGVIYAVPGNPFIAESTCPAIADKAKLEGIEVRIVEGLSFIESVFAALQLDPFPRAALVDAFELARANHPWFPPDSPALIAQVHSQALAAEVKLTLMAVYPDDHPMTLVHGAGTDFCVVENVPLYKIDRSEHTGLLTTVYVPELAKYSSFEAFQEIIAHLRAPDGCPWDRKQTHKSLRPYLLEETYEVLEALDGDDPQKLAEEFGDLLLQIVLHAQIAVEAGDFSMADILQGISGKLVRRHPHVFGDIQVDGVEGVVKNWEDLKAEERKEKGEAASVLNGVASAMPALAQSSAYQKRASRVGFEWPDIKGVYEKILEEIEEVKSAPNIQNRSDELGDLLFAVVHLADWYQVDPETALREANGRFRKRFMHVEAAARVKGLDLRHLSIGDLDKLWEDAKKVARD